MVALRNILAVFAATETLPTPADLVTALVGLPDGVSIGGAGFSPAELSAIDKVCTAVYAVNREAAATDTSLSNSLLVLVGAVKACREAVKTAAEAAAAAAVLPDSLEEAPVAVDGIPSAGATTADPVAEVAPQGAPVTVTVADLPSSKLKAESATTTGVGLFSVIAGEPNFSHPKTLAALTDDLKTAVQTRNSIAPLGAFGLGLTSVLTSGGMDIPEDGGDLNNQMVDTDYIRLSALQASGAIAEALSGVAVATIKADDGPFCGVPDVLKLAGCGTYMADTTMFNAFGNLSIPSGQAIFAKPLSRLDFPSSASVWNPCATPQEPKNCIRVGCRGIGTVRTTPLVSCVMVDTIRSLDPAFTQDSMTILKTSLAVLKETWTHNSIIAAAEGPFVHTAGYSSFRSYVDGLVRAIASFRSRMQSRGVEVHVGLPEWFELNHLVDIVNGPDISTTGGVGDVLSGNLFNNVTFHSYIGSESSNSQLVEAPSGSTPARWPNYAIVYIWAQGAAFSGSTQFQPISVSTIQGEKVVVESTEATNNSAKLMLEEGVSFSRISECGPMETHIFQTCPSGNYAGPVVLTDYCDEVVAPPVEGGLVNARAAVAEVAAVEVAEVAPEEATEALEAEVTAAEAEVAAAEAEVAVAEAPSTKTRASK